ncbi:MAG: class I mannose-6-phosphate isomerase [Sphingomonas sp.]
MTATKLSMKRVDKPWGRHQLWPGFDDPAPDSAPVGEIWFEAPGASDPDLLIKYLFTSEKLSVQVHPDDARARAAGFARGKDEAWVILAAAPDSTIALGTRAPLSEAAFRAAALDGSIAELLDWKPVQAGDVFYSAAGTVHAIGAGITLVEVQQNVDLTYRLYDYGRLRELHLEAAIAVANRVPFVAHTAPGDVGEGRQILVAGPKFTLERWSGGDRRISLPQGTGGWLVPLEGRGDVDGATWHAGECWGVAGEVAIAADPGSDLLLAYSGADRAAVLAR